MNHILKFFDSHCLSGLIFVDFIYLTRLKSENSERAQQDYHSILTQLKRAQTLGFELGLHLHPHWLDAVYNHNENNWIFPTYDRYTVQSLTPQTRADVFENSIQEFRCLSDRPVRFFRAGGWCIEPFEPLKEHFVRHGLRFDSSVVPGLSYPGRLQPFDFRPVAKAEKPWKFRTSTLIPDVEGEFQEFPVTSYELSLIARATNIFGRKEIKFFGDGINMQTSRVSFFSRWIHKLTKGGVGILSLETEKTISEGERVAKATGDGLLVSVTHPKGLQKSPDLFSKMKNSWVTRIPCWND